MILRRNGRNRRGRSTLLEAVPWKAGLLRLQLLSWKACLLRLLEALLTRKTRLLRLLETLLTGETSLLRLLKSWTLAWKAGRLWGELLELLLLLLLRIKPRLHRILVPLSPLRHLGRSWSRIALQSPLSSWSWSRVKLVKRPLRSILA